MSTALIGHTGFVGGNLRRQVRFDDCFNSANIETIAGREYELIVCCGARAEKWRANQDPLTDRQGIERLMKSLSRARAREMILVSTVDVFANPRGVDELTPVVSDKLTPYGRHRYELEQFIQRNYSALIVRLPGLFGLGLKKNVIYDFLHDNSTDKIHHSSRFQFYDLSRLWNDIQTARKAGLKLVHFATEPVSVQDVARFAFDLEFEGTPATPPAIYDFRTRHAALFGGQNGYLFDRGDVLRGIRAFVQSEMAGVPCR